MQVREKRDESPKRHSHQRERSRSRERTHPGYQSTSPSYSPMPVSYLRDLNNSAPIPHPAISVALDQREQNEKIQKLHKQKHQLKERNEKQLKKIKKLQKNRDDLKKELEQMQQSNDKTKESNDKKRLRVLKYEHKLQIQSLINNNNTNSKPIELKSAKTTQSHSNSISYEKKPISIEEKIERLERYCRANSTKILNLKEENAALQNDLNMVMVKNRELMQEKMVLKQKILDLKARFAVFQIELQRQSEAAAMQAELERRREAAAIQAELERQRDAAAIQQKSEMHSRCVFAMFQALQNFKQPQPQMLNQNLMSMSQNFPQQQAMAPMLHSTGFFSQPPEQGNIENQLQLNTPFFSYKP